MSVKKHIERSEQDVSDLGEDISVRLKDALTSANDWKDGATNLIKKNPVACLAGAFLVGFALAKVARHA